MTPRPNLRLLDAVSERQWRRREANYDGQEKTFEEESRESLRMLRRVALLCLLVIAVTIYVMVTIGGQP